MASAEESLSDIGVFGMGVMGQNLCLNAADNGFAVSAYNRVDEFQARIWGALERAKEEVRCPRSLPYRTVRAFRPQGCWSCYPRELAWVCP
jgi:3-hydroxyacyl-CoA dehydrogenase